MPGVPKPFFHVGFYILNSEQKCQTGTITNHINSLSFKPEVKNNYVETSVPYKN
jgi:hypothetical protein